MKLISKKTVFVGAVLVVVAAALLFAARNRRVGVSEYFTTPIAAGSLRNVLTESQ